MEAKEEECTGVPVSVVVGFEALDDADVQCFITLGNTLVKMGNIKLFLVVMALFSNNLIASSIPGVSNKFPPPFPFRNFGIPDTRADYFLLYGVILAFAYLILIWQRLQPTRSTTSTTAVPTTTTTTIAPLPLCPEGYTPYSTQCGRFCYRFNLGSCARWDDARRICQTEGGDLLVPTECHYEFFQTEMRRNQGECDNVWIGGSSDTPRSNFVSVRNDPIPNNFRFWDAGEPNGGNPNRQCTEMRQAVDYRMNDASCDRANTYICQVLIN